MCKIKPQGTPWPASFLRPGNVFLLASILLLFLLYLGVELHCFVEELPFILESDISHFVPYSPVDKFFKSLFAFAFLTTDFCGCAMDHISPVPCAAKCGGRTAIVVIVNLVS